MVAGESCSLLMLIGTGRKVDFDENVKPQKHSSDVSNDHLCSTQDSPPRLPMRLLIALHPCCIPHTHQSQLVVRVLVTSSLHPVTATGGGGGGSSR